jgi:hypothetical protein
MYFLFSNKKEKLGGLRGEKVTDWHAAPVRWQADGGGVFSRKIKDLFSFFLFFYLYLITRLIGRRRRRYDY